MMENIAETHKISKAEICDAIPLGRATYYRWKNQEDPKQDPLLHKIKEIALEYPRYGYRRITAELRNNSIIANRKRVLAIMRSEGLLCKKKKKAPSKRRNRQAWVRLPVTPFSLE